MRCPGRGVPYAASDACASARAASALPRSDSTWARSCRHTASTARSGARRALHAADAAREQRHRALVLVLVAELLGQHAVELRLQRDVGDAAGRRLRALQERVGARLVLVLAVEVGEGQQHPRPQHRVVGELAVDRLFAARQQLRHRHRLATAFLEQEGHELVARLAVRELLQSAVALLRTACRAATSARSASTVARCACQSVPTMPIAIAASVSAPAATAPRWRRTKRVAR